MRSAGHHEMKARHVNLVFQGGGVRGIAHAGALYNKPSWCQVHGVGGTSAGALVAALLAVGKEHKELKAILESPELFRLLSDEDQARSERLRKASHELQPRLKSFFSKRSGWRRLQRIPDALAIQRILSDSWPDLKGIWDAWGVHGSSKLRSWLDEVLEGRSFGDVKEAKHVDDLRIVAADLRAQKYRIFDIANDRAHLISQAVHASVSMPLFFVPFRVDEDVYVDGGILSNFPSFLFAQSQYPTIGLRLEDVPPLKGWADIAAKREMGRKIATTEQFLLSLLYTMLEAHDKFRDPPRRFKCYVVETPSDISSLKFDLTKVEVDRLYTKGKACAIDWEQYTSEQPRASLYDPNAGEALTETMEQAQLLRRKYYEPEQFVEKLAHAATFTMRLERDWTTVYERVNGYQVWGRKPLIATQHSTSGFLGPSSSLVDHFPVLEEVVPDGGARAVPWVPCSSDEEEKTFLAFFVPPIIEGQPIRNFRSTVTIPEGMAATVAMGKDDEVWYGARQIAHDHRLNLTFRVQIDAELASVFPRARFNADLTQRENIVLDGRIYRVWDCRVPETVVTEEAHFCVDVCSA
jgi:predicted acylesterase/phospholipase RssA